MTQRPIFRPMSYLWAVWRITASLTGNTVPASSRAILYVGQSMSIQQMFLVLDTIAFPTVTSAAHSTAASLVRCGCTFGNRSCQALAPSAVIIVRRPILRAVRRPALISPRTVVKPMAF
jgi:uncharacterized membrane protein